MQRIHANLMQRCSLKDAAMQHHVVSQWTPTHAANLRYCKKHSGLMQTTRVGLSPTKTSSDDR